MRIFHAGDARQKPLTAGRLPLLVNLLFCSTRSPVERFTQTPTIYCSTQVIRPASLRSSGETNRLRDSLQSPRTASNSSNRKPILPWMIALVISPLNAFQLIPIFLLLSLHRRAKVVRDRSRLGRAGSCSKTGGIAVCQFYFQQPMDESQISLKVGDISSLQLFDVLIHCRCEYLITLTSAGAHKAARFLFAEGVQLLTERDL